MNSYFKGIFKAFRVSSETTLHFAPESIFRLTGLLNTSAVTLILFCVLGISTDSMTLFAKSWTLPDSLTKWDFPKYLQFWINVGLETCCLDF